ncbi:MAG: hypothetical protein AAF386_13575 [Pseudomonadota bacterium]
MALIALSGCAGGFERDVTSTDKSQDRSRDAKPISELVAGIWVDPNGCDHWIIDDGVEGYLSARLNDDGTPVCTGHGAETVVYGPFKSGSPEVNGQTESTTDGTGNSGTINAIPLSAQVR